MGNTQPKSQVNEQAQPFHEKFKKVSILQNSQQMVLTIAYEQLSDLQEWQKLLRSVKQCDPQFLLMPKKYMATEQGICGSSGILKIVYDCFTYSFEEQIRNHAEKEKHFEQSQIWYLLFAIISSVKEMNRLEIKVGDIRPYNIFVNENGQVKLSGIYSWPRQIQNYLKTSYDKTITYLAPQQLVQCRIGQKGKKLHIIGQSFSVGLTLLHTCLLKPMDHLYNIKKLQFNNEGLQKEINQLRNLNFWNQQKQIKQKYSDELISIIIGLLNTDQTKRLTTLQLFDQLQPNAEEILNLRQFQPPYFKLPSPRKQTIVPTNDKFKASKTDVSPPYSSIPRKDYNEPQSLAFQASNGFVLTNKNLTQPQKQTPQKSKLSKQKIRLSLSNEKRKNPVVKTIQPQRQSISRQKVNSNGVSNFTSINKHQQNYKPQVPLGGNLPGQFSISDNNFQSYRPSIGSTINPINPIPQYHQYGQKKFQPPVKFNNLPTNYMSYQPKYQITQTTEYRTVTQTPAFNYNNVQTSFSYKPIMPQISNINYPFTTTVDLTKSQYKLIDKTQSYNIGDDNPIKSKTTNYQTSIVKPILPGQTSFITTGIGSYGAGIESKGYSDQQDFLKKIDQQLNISKSMYPTSNL